jgi:predicted nucleic acid-binding protein
MILYLDTSSLVKLYVEENDSSKIADLVIASEISATSLIAYAESRSAFARRFREKAFTASEYKRLVNAFNADWNNYFIINVTTELVKFAGELAENHHLRGFDAIHLSSALTLYRELSSSVIFSCYDKNLQNASKLEKLEQPK